MVCDYVSGNRLCNQLSVSVCVTVVVVLCGETGRVRSVIIMDEVLCMFACVKPYFGKIKKISEFATGGGSGFGGILKSAF